MELIENDNTKKRVILRLATSKNTYTVMIPLNWNVKKLKSFIIYTFKEIPTGSSINIYSEGKKLSDDFTLNKIPIQDSKYPHFFITAKQEDKKEDVIDSIKINDVVIYF